MVFYGNDATQLHTYEMNRRLQIYKITKKKINQFMSMKDIKLFAKNEKELEILI